MEHEPTKKELVSVILDLLYIMECDNEYKGDYFYERDKAEILADLNDLDVYGLYMRLEKEDKEQAELTYKRHFLN